ncbi:MAG: hypothetical protein U9N00_02885 [Candidatus Bipolaricaulota bacterium]|nr:hypothetical protein [Candidatus Bipolaricaulota bacterium]
MPVKAGTGVSFFAGPPIVSCLAFSLHNGKLTESRASWCVRSPLLGLGP